MVSPYVFLQDGPEAESEAYCCSKIATSTWGVSSGCLLEGMVVFP